MTTQPTLLRSFAPTPRVGTRSSREDFGVLSLPDRHLYRLSEAGRFATLGPGMAARIEDLMRDIADELDLPSPDDRPADRPA